jgi:hypothetical protein
MTRKEHTRFQNNKNADRERTSNKRFQKNGKPEHDITDDASQIKAEDLKKRKTKGFL